MAEDDPLMSRMYERAFRLGGHAITLTYDGDEALKTLETMNPKPDLIMLDVMMPKMSGFDVLRKIKANEQTKNIPVVLLTNLAGQDDAEKGLSLGAVLYLIKSQYNPRQVVSKIEEIIKATKHGEGIPEVEVAVKDIESQK